MSTSFIVHGQTTGLNRPAKFLILLKHWGHENFELNWFHRLSKSLATPFSQVSADSFHVNIREYPRSLYAFIAVRPTCFPRRLVMRNLHQTSTQRARKLYPDSKNNSRRITYGIGCVSGMPSLSLSSSLDKTYHKTNQWHVIFVIRGRWRLCWIAHSASKNSELSSKYRV